MIANSLMSENTTDDEYSIAGHFDPKVFVNCYQSVLICQWFCLLIKEFAIIQHTHEHLQHCCFLRGTRSCLNETPLHTMHVQLCVVCVHSCGALHFISYVHPTTYVVSRARPYHPRFGNSSNTEGRGWLARVQHTRTS